MSNISDHLLWVGLRGLRIGQNQSGEESMKTVRALLEAISAKRNISPSS